MIRIAQQGVGRLGTAKTVDEVVAGYGCSWVEVDGVVLGAKVIAASFEANGDEFSTLVLRLEVSDTVEIVYVDRDGNPLPDGGEPRKKLTNGEALALTRLDADALVPVVPRDSDVPT